MRADEFWRDQPFGGSPALNLDLLRSLRAGPSASWSDLEVAIALEQMISNDLIAFGTAGGQQMTDAGSREALRTLGAIVNRLGIVDFSPPFSDFPSFRGYWMRIGASGGGGWQARRDIVHQFFEPLKVELERREDDALQGGLLAPVSPAGRTGWEQVDVEILELRRHFSTAQSAQDYRNIGNDCVAVLEAVSRAAYDPHRHLPLDEAEPPVANTKARFDQIVNAELPGSANAEMRKYGRGAIELAQAVKHAPNGTRLQAGLSADAAISVANLLRRLLD